MVKHISIHGILNTCVPNLISIKINFYEVQQHFPANIVLIRMNKK